jgi:hypothetical protein
VQTTFWARTGFLGQAYGNCQENGRINRCPLRRS